MNAIRITDTTDLSHLRGQPKATKQETIIEILDRLHKLIEEAHAIQHEAQKLVAQLGKGDSLLLKETVSGA